MNFATEAIEPARQYVLSTAKDPDLLEVRHCLLARLQADGRAIPRVRCMAGRFQKRPGVPAGNGTKIIRLLADEEFDDWMTT